MDYRAGFGTDLHRLEPGDGLWLGGVKIPCLYLAKAHSDGDVLLHALIDALLGAAAQGDIGDHFPEKKVAKGESSARLLAKTLALLAPTGMRVVNVDCVIDLEVVRLCDWKDAIRASVANLLNLDKARINVKAKSAERLGPIGKGRAVAAQAIVLVEFIKETKE